jgi:hypothetical protein
MIRYILSKNIQKLCDNPDLSDNGRFIRPMVNDEKVFVNIIDTCVVYSHTVTIKIKCFYPDGHIEEGWTFRDVICPIEFHNFYELLDGRFNQ